MQFLNIFLKSNCPLCGRSTNEVICIDCDRQISACKSPKFYQLLKEPSGELNLFGWGIYDSCLKQAIATLKFESKSNDKKTNHPELAQPLGIKIGETWNQDSIAQNLVKYSKKLVVVPIPIYAEKLKTRGFNQAELLARSFCDVTKLAIAPHILRRVKNTKPQIDTKSKLERQENLSCAFSIGKVSNQNISVLLFDDIYTSGATVKEAISTLKSANINVIGVIVLAIPPFKEIVKEIDQSQRYPERMS
jgi:ComF family protein